MRYEIPQSDERSRHGHHQRPFPYLFPVHKSSYFA
jgi:hypothetical protein